MSTPTSFNSYQNSALSFQLAEAMGGPNANIAQIQQIKANAKSLLGRGGSEEEATELLHIIVLANEIIMNQKIEDHATPEELKATYQNYLDSSVRSVSGAIRSGQFSEVIKETSAQFSKIKAADIGEGNDSLKEADELISDVELYSFLHIEQAVAPYEERLSPIDQLLAPYGAKTLRTGGGGACFYKAISITDEILASDRVPENLREAEGRHLELRKKTTDYMREKGSGTRANIHSRPTTWATDAEIRYLVGAQGERDGSDNQPILVLQSDPTSSELRGTIYSKAIDDEGHYAHPPTPDNLRVIVDIGNYHYEAVATTRESREHLISQFNVVAVL